MTTEEVGAYLHISRSTIYRLIRAGKIPCFRLGDEHRFNREQIDEWCKLSEKRAARPKL